MAKNPKRAQVKIYGKMAHNSAFVYAIGELIIAWSNNESVFLAVLQAMLPYESGTAARVWYSHRTTRNRLQLVSTLASEKISDPGLARQLNDAITHFLKLSKTRNFFCHAHYEYDKQLCLRSAYSATVDDGYSSAIKPMNAATLNEIQNTTALLHTFNKNMWILVRSIDAHLGLIRDDKSP